MRLSDDPLPHTLVQRPADYRREQRIRVGFRQPFEPQLRQPGQLVELTLPTLREHQDDRLRLQAPRHERKHLRRRLIKPLRIVDQTDKRLFTARQQTQHGEADQEAIGPGARAQAKGGRKRLTLGRRQPPQPAEQRRTQLVKSPQTEAPSRTAPRPREEPGNLRHDSAVYSRSAVFPIPASPRSTSTALCPACMVSRSRSSSRHSDRRPRSIAQPDPSKQEIICDQDKTQAPGKKPAAEEQPETEVDGFVIVAMRPSAGGAFSSRRNPRAKEDDTASPSSRAIDLPSNVAVGPSGRRSSVTPPGLREPDAVAGAWTREHD